MGRGSERNEKSLKQEGVFVVTARETKGLHAASFPTLSLLFLHSGIRETFLQNFLDLFGPL